MKTEKRYGPPIPCIDNSKRGYTVVEEEVWRTETLLDGQESKSKGLSTFYRNVDGQFRKVNRKLDPKTGKPVFYCPVEDITIRPIDD